MSHSSHRRHLPPHHQPIGVSTKPGLFTPAAAEPYQQPLHSSHPPSSFHSHRAKADKQVEEAAYSSRRERAAAVDAAGVLSAPPASPPPKSSRATTSSSASRSPSSIPPCSSSSSAYRPPSSSSPSYSSSSPSYSSSSPSYAAASRSNTTPTTRHQQQAAGDRESPNLLELEHIIGYTGRFQNTFLAHPTDPNKTIASQGATVVVSDFEDSHNQQLLRMHDMEVSALAISHSGALIASGQVGTTHQKGYAAPIVVWDYQTKGKMFILQGLTHQVTKLAFSPDDRLLIGTDNASYLPTSSTCNNNSNSSSNRPASSRGGDILSGIGQGGKGGGRGSSCKVEGGAAAAGATGGMMMIWDLQTGELIYSQRYARPLRLIQWCSVYLKGRRRAYELALASSKEVDVGEFSFDVSKMQWQLEVRPVTMPTIGISRTYLCSTVTPDAEQLLAGTEVGDMTVIKLSTRVYRANIPIGSGGVWSLLVQPTSSSDTTTSNSSNNSAYNGSSDNHSINRRGITTIDSSSSSKPAAAAVQPERRLMQEKEDGKEGIQSYYTLYCGCGDGTIKKIVGSDMRWQLVQAIRLGTPTLIIGAIFSLSFTADHLEIIAPTTSGTSYRLLLDDDLSSRVIGSGHTASITCVAFPKERSDLIATGSLDGSLKVWDLNSYDALTTIHNPEGGDGSSASKSGVLCLHWIGSSSLLSGWEDGFLRAYDAISGTREWHVPNAHRRGVTAVASYQDAETGVAYIASGGGDGSIRIWQSRTREMLMQFVEHIRAVTQIMVDIKQPHLLHSTGLNCKVLSYNLKTQRRYNSHMVREGSFYGLTQRMDSEQELITCDSHGRLLFWDCDYPDPVLAISDDSSSRLSSVLISPASHTYLATTGADSLVKIMDIRELDRTIGPVGLGRGHSGLVTAVAWSPDEKQLVTVGDDCSIAVWNFYKE